MFDGLNCVIAVVAFEFRKMFSELLDLVRIFEFFDKEVEFV